MQVCCRASIYDINFCFAFAYERLKRCLEDAASAEYLEEETYCPSRKAALFAKDRKSALPAEQEKTQVCGTKQKTKIFCSNCGGMLKSAGDWKICVSTFGEKSWVSGTFATPFKLLSPPPNENRFFCRPLYAQKRLSIAYAV